jgi:type IX secretion system PorP/SprF family membrane protein
MTSKFYTVLIFFYCFGIVGFSQQLPQYSQYMFNKIAYNPGVTGTTNGICVGGLIRQQWVGFKETNAAGNSFNVAPETYVFTINAPVKALRGGLGGTIIQDKIGHQDIMPLYLPLTTKSISAQQKILLKIKPTFWDKLQKNNLIS